MDFLNDAIKAEISKKRKTLETAKSGNAKKKYVSRAELERMREEEYLRQEAEQRAKELEVCQYPFFFTSNTSLNATCMI